MRVLVVTVVHTPLDARIHARQIGALRAAGHDVTYVAPWSDHGIAPAEVHPGVATLDVPRAQGRDRMASLRAARRHIDQLAPRHDLVLLHDPELVGAVVGLRSLRDRVVVLDVHEDTHAALVDKPWLPDAARTVVGSGVRAVERWAERNLRLLLAEERYADRFGTGLDGQPHPIVPNTPWVPDEAAAGPTEPLRAVHVGRLSLLRGAPELLAVGAALAGEIELHLIGPADAEVLPAVQAAHDAGKVVWHGFVPNEQALAMVDGAIVGLSLLRDAPNYRHSMPTKIWEYLGRGVPVVATALPRAAEAVNAADAGQVVPFEDPDAVVAAVRSLGADRAQARAAGLRGHAHVRAHHAWNEDGPSFVAQLTQWVAQRHSV